MKTRTAPEPRQEDFEALLQAHRGIVFKLANAYCRGFEERDDLVQEICLQLWRSFPSYDRERRFSTWMYRVALNTGISFARAARSRHEQVVPLEDSKAASLLEAPAPSASEERIAWLHRFLHGIDELDRALVVLYLEDRSYREIAEILGISETNVGTKLSRWIQKMRRDLAAENKEAHDGTERAR